MHVVATAGHVDHGKSTLVRALTGMEPDRWAEERRRGMTIDLGFAWTSVGEQVIGFVDVPGHQRFLGNMLAGLGPAPAVLFVVAADEGWGRQSAEHLAAIDGLGLRHALLAVTRSDLADPADAVERARCEIAGSSLGDVPAVVVSGKTRAGLADLRAGLRALVHGLPAPNVEGPVRLWVDRSFTIRGAGTVVTGTLASGSLRAGDVVQVGGREVVIRGLQSLGQSCQQVTANARVAINLRGVDRDEVRRGDVLLTGAWRTTNCVDVRLQATDAPRDLVLHVGTAAVPVRVRALGEGGARLQLKAALPLRVGDRGLLREPAGQRVVGGVVVLDTDPPPLTRRGAAASRARDLVDAPDRPDLVIELRRRGAVRVSELTSMGIDTAPVEGSRQMGEWLVEGRRFDAWVSGLIESVDDHVRTHPLDAGQPQEMACRQAGIPLGLLDEVVRAAGLRAVRGRVLRPGAVPDLGVAEDAVALLEKRLGAAPFDAPSSEELRDLGLTAKHLAAAQTAGRLLVLGDVVVAADAVEMAGRLLAPCAEPFSVAAARTALGARRSVAVALLEHLDREGVTRRLAGGVRRLVSAPAAGSAPSP